MRSPLEQFDIINIKNITLLGFDVSLNNIILPLLILILIIVIYVYSEIYKFHIIPKYLQNILELLYNFILTIIKQQAGNYGIYWFPFTFTIFNLILFCNLLSLIPFGIALTSHLISILWLSCTICVSIFTIGLSRFNLKFSYIFIPQCPFISSPILIPIEIFSYLIRLFSLSIRLAANILAGHTLVHIIVAFISKIIKIDFILALIAMLPLFLTPLLEFGVAFLQAYVFTVSISIYSSDTEKKMQH